MAIHKTVRLKKFNGKVLQIVINSEREAISISERGWRIPLVIPPYQQQPL